MSCGYVCDCTDAPCTCEQGDVVDACARAVAPWPHAKRLVHAGGSQVHEAETSRYACGALCVYSGPGATSHAPIYDRAQRVTCEACRHAVREQEGGR
jgi:hypothetical protein